MPDEKDRGEVISLFASRRKEKPDQSEPKKGSEIEPKLAKKVEHPPEVRAFQAKFRTVVFVF